jgi:hypothetical protein
MFEGDSLVEPSTELNQENSTNGLAARQKLKLEQLEDSSRETAEYE